MVRTRIVIAERLRRILTKEQRTYVVDLSDVLSRVLSYDLHVLRCKLVCKLDGVVLVLAADDRAVVCHGVVDDVLSGEVRGLALYLCLRAYCNIHAGGYHDRAGELVVLSLGHKVSREVNRVRSLICKY